MSVELCEDLFCPVCLDFFKEPVILTCGHNFCKSCIDKVWNFWEGISCPECREEFPAKTYTSNRLLSKFVETAQKAQQCEEAGKPHQEQKTECVLQSHECFEHKKLLKLFCQEDGSPICVACMISSKHAGHKFLPLQEAVSIFQETLKMAEVNLKLKINWLNECQSKQEQCISGIQAETQGLEQHIRLEFAKLQVFLKDKQQHLIQQLTEESTGIMGKMKENLKNIEENNKAVQGHLSDIQSKLQQEDPMVFLTGIMDEIERILIGEEKEDRANVEVVSENLSPGVYKGPLQYSVWKEMLSVINPGLSYVTLNPKWTDPSLILYDSLTSVRSSHTKKMLNYVSQQLLEDPERSDSCQPFVIGSTGLTSGRHYWEVEMRNKAGWNVGVIQESSLRNGEFAMNSENGYWIIFLRGGNKYFVLDSLRKDLKVRKKPKKIGVYMDYEGGQVSFYNADNMSHIYTFTNTFTETLYPSFWVSYDYISETPEPLKIFHLKL